MGIIRNNQDARLLPNDLARNRRHTLTSSHSSRSSKRMLAFNSVAWSQRLSLRKRVVAGSTRTTPFTYRILNSMTRYFARTETIVQFCNERLTKACVGGTARSVDNSTLKSCSTRCGIQAISALSWDQKESESIGICISRQAILKVKETT
jgi:hypothetical protein